MNITTYTEQDKQFYPTPKSLLKLIENDFMEQLKCFHNELKYDIRVLEPTAGKGNIALHLRDYWGRYSYDHTPRCKVDCIEIDTTLQATLKGLNFPVVCDDFLYFNTFTKYDLIFMNPPFANAEDHLMKAIKLQEKYGGRIICILNAETIKNTYTLKRQELKAKLYELNAEIKYYSDAFNAPDSERKSSVEIAVVWLDILAPKNIFNSKVFESLDKAEKVNFQTETTEEQYELIRLGLDWITALVEQYNRHIESAISFFKEYEAFRTEYYNRYENIEGNSYKTAFKLVIYDSDYNGINTFIENTRRKYWKSLFDHPKFSSILTSRLQSELSSRLDEMKNYDFNERNILRLMEENRVATLKGIEEEILALFDTFTKHAQYDGCDNVHYYNGWKTNKAHKLNNKIIIPFYGAWKSEPRYVGNNMWNMRRSGYEYKLDHYEALRTLRDMSKTLNYLAKGVSGIQDMEHLSNIIYSQFNNGNAKNIPTEHFILTFYKKGTCHIKFRNQDLLDKFNLFASQR
ncbi:MAG: DUF4942 domain-containing protein, partial [Clostridia bacterium]|nr:DUF4942 domain-containing protein [Clostridia bacterium]